MIKANPHKKLLIVEILSKAFEENRSVNFIVRQDNKKRQRIRSLMQYSLDVCSLFGEVWLSEDRKASALVLYPASKKTTLTSVWLGIQLIFRAIGLGGIQKTLNREAQIKKLQPKESMAYLWFIGVYPPFQHSGIGSKLLQEVIEDVDKKNLPLYLETSTIENLPWYERFGFKVYDQLDLGYTLYFLKREPGKS